MIVYKLVRELSDKSLSPLFINKKTRLKVGSWINAELCPTKGFATRKGWHCLLEPAAPHLSKKGRVWIKAEVDDFELYNRPESQGGTWVLAQKMKVLEKLN